MPRTAPDPQQFQLAAALHPASRNKRTNTQDKLTAFLSTSFKTLCCTAHCHLSFFPAEVSTGPQTTFSFWRDQNLDVLPKLFPTSFLKTRRQANNPPARCPQTSSDAGSTFFPAHNFAAQAWLQPTHCGMGWLLYVGAGAFLQLPYRCTSSNLNQHKQHAQFSHNNTTMPNSQSRLGCQDAWMHAWLSVSGPWCQHLQPDPAASAHTPSQCTQRIQ